MNVIIDANILVGNIKTQGMRAFSAAAFASLLQHLRHVQGTLVIPGPVRDEIVRQHQLLIHGSIHDAQRMWDALKRNASSDLEPLKLPDADVEEDIFLGRLLSPGRGVAVKILEDYDSVSVREIVRRGVERIRPASDGGEQLRDVVIWLMILEYAKKSKIPTHFICNDDKAFRDKDKNVHPDIQEDIGDLNLKIYKGIDEFYDTNKLESTDLTGNEMLALVRQEALLDLFKLRFEQMDYDDVIVRDVQLWDGKKYKVNDDSYYVEGSCSASLYYSDTYEEPPSAYEPRISGLQRAFAPRAVRLADLARSDYRSASRRKWFLTVDATLSFRLVAGSVESPELRGIDTMDVHLISQSPIIVPPKP
jgi:hypothetical protein